MAQVPWHKSNQSDLRQHPAKFEHLSQWEYDVGMCERQRGIWNHTNVRKASDKQDMFPQQELIDMLLSL